MGIADDSDYGDATSRIQENVTRFERAVSRVRAAYRDESVSEVLAALDIEFSAEGIEVWKEVAEDAARMIASRGVGD